MNFDVYGDGACGADKIKTFAPRGVKGFVLGTTLLFGQNRSYKETIEKIREMDI
jgi:ribulose-phosphate 3-epimerase